MTNIYNPRMILVDENFFYISDQHSVFIYDLMNFKLVKQLLKKGEGPKETLMTPLIAINQNKLMINCIHKIIIYSRNFKFLKEIRTQIRSSEVFPVDNFFVSMDIKPKIGQVFSLYNENLDKIKDFFIEKPSVYSNPEKYVIVPDSFIRTFNNEIFINQPNKGFQFIIFDQFGNRRMIIKKDIVKVKAKMIHLARENERLLNVLGKQRYNKLDVSKKNTRKSLPKYLPDIKNFFITDNKIYVKTYDITETKDKYIILDLKGKILKTIFLPKTYYRKYCFGKNKFYYIREDESDNGCMLHIVDLSKR